MRYIVYYGRWRSSKVIETGTIRQPVWLIVTRLLPFTRSCDENSRSSRFYPPESHFKERSLRNCSYESQYQTRSSAVAERPRDAS